jgi:hypothetical protein
MQHSNLISLLWWLIGRCNTLLAHNPSDVFTASLLVVAREELDHQLYDPNPKPPRWITTYCSGNLPGQHKRNKRK